MMTAPARLKGTATKQGTGTLTVGLLRETLPPGRYRFARSGDIEYGMKLCSFLWEWISRHRKINHFMQTVWTTLLKVIYKVHMGVHSYFNTYVLRFCAHCFESQMNNNQLLSFDK